MCYAVASRGNTALLETLNSALAAGHARIESCDSAFIEGAIDQAITVESKEIRDLYTAHKLLAFLAAALRMLKEA
jgi:hypothetical protein